MTESNNGQGDETSSQLSMLIVVAGDPAGGLAGNGGPKTGYSPGSSVISVIWVISMVARTSWIRVSTFTRRSPGTSS